MEFDLSTVKLDRDDLNTIHDVILNALDINVDDETIIKYWNAFPEDIKLDAMKWGVSDTPTRDEMYEWLIENGKLE